MGFSDRAAGDSALPENVFGWLDQARERPDVEAAFDRLIEHFTRERDFRAVFDARLMKSRWQLGLPLVSAPAIADVPASLQQPYQQAYVDAAREAGTLFLSSGDLAHAYPYFRAIGDTAPVRDALETFRPDESAPLPPEDAVHAAIQIAFLEGVHPQKGFELILTHHGMCRAVTMFGSYPGSDGRDESLRLLVRSLHADIVTALKAAIAAAEGSAPDTASIAALIEGRAWLFDHNSQYTDSSHLAALLRFAGDLRDDATLALAVEIADYGRHLSEMFQYADDPPFERTYEDRAIYLRALLGQDVDRAVAHFDAKAAELAPTPDGPVAGEVLVSLLCRVGRYRDAMAAFRRYLGDAEDGELRCPSLAQICELAGDFEELKRLAKQAGSPLTYFAGVLGEGRR